MMDFRRCGRNGLLVEMGGLDAVLDMHAALSASPPDGVIEMVPAARTVLLHFDSTVTDGTSLERAVRATEPRRRTDEAGAVVEIPVTYDGEDLAEVGELTGWGGDGVVARHTSTRWLVAFCGFAPGFAYLVAEDGGWDVPRRASPRTKVPAGSVALAGEFSSVYPRESPGGWQLIGRTEVGVFDLERDPPALLTPGVRVRFVDVGRPPETS